MFVIRGLDPQLFAHYFAMSDAELAAVDARRVIADGPRYPCRVSLVDATVGEELVLCHFAHHEVASPYRAAGPIYVRRAAMTTTSFIDDVPPVLASRLLSVRAYRADGHMLAAEVVAGTELRAHIERMFGDVAYRDVAYLHAHNARPGCFAARIDRH